MVIMAVQYKQKCCKCKKNYVLASYRNRYVTCDECDSKEMTTPITDPEMIKFFDIPEDFYKKNSFLKDIKRNYLKYGKLSERQMEAFKETVEKMTEKAKEADKK